MSRQYIGSLHSHRPLRMAELCIAAADTLSVTSKRVFALTCDSHKRLWVQAARDRKIDPAEWIATFSKKSDPDWLEEEIKAAQS